jgi:hypothetical protein
MLVASTGTTTRATALSGADPLGEVMLRSPRSAVEAIDACDALSRAGKLPGFKRTSPTSGEARVFGQPFDSDLLVSAIDAPGGSVVRLSTRLRRKIPVLFAVVGVATVWPGVWLTDSLIQTYFSGASNWVVKTWMWYLPLAIIPLPFAARSMWRKSRDTAAEHFAELQQRIAATVGASMDASATPARRGASPSREAESLSASA